MCVACAVVGVLAAGGASVAAAEELLTGAWATPTGKSSTVRFAVLTVSAFGAAQEAVVGPGQPGWFDPSVVRQRRIPNRRAAPAEPEAAGLHGWVCLRAGLCGSRLPSATP